MTPAVTVLRRQLLVALAVFVVGCSHPGPGPSLTIAATGDAQIVLLANVYAAGLRYYGTDARVQTVADPVAALDTGKVSVTPGFTGRLLQRFAPGSAARSAEQVYRAMIGALPEGVASADYAVGAEDKPALAVSTASAARWGSRDLTALVRNCAGLTVGAVAGVSTPAAVGECTLPPVRQFPDPATLFDALRSGVVGAVWTTTADTSVPDGVVVLVDRKPTLVPAENVVALYRRNELGKMQLRAINELAGVLDTAALVDMVRQVESGADPRSVAEAWLAANPLGR